MAKLGQNRSVNVLDQRMDDAFRVHYDLDPLRRQAEQPMRFDHFEALVHHGGGVYADLAPHHPIRMGTGFGRGHAREFRDRPCPKRTARRGEKYPAHTGLPRVARVAQRQALENRVVLAVNGEQRRAAPRRRRHEHGATDDERFLVGEQDALAGAGGGKRGPQTGRPDDRCHDGIRAAPCRGFDDTRLPPEDPRRQPGARQRALEAARRLQIRHCGDLRPVAQAELRELLPLAVGGERRNAEPVGMAGYDIEGRVADRAGGTEQADPASSHRR
jgi:hypothetical protein